MNVSLLLSFIMWLYAMHMQNKKHPKSKRNTRRTNSATDVAWHRVQKKNKMLLTGFEPARTNVHWILSFAAGMGPIVTE